jgi:hypothetical protein
MFKKLPMLFLLSLSISFAIAADQQRGHGRPQLTDTQKTCLEGKLGARDSGNRPSREAMEAAMSACGVEKPKGPPPGEQPADQQDQNQDSNQTAD